MEYAQSTEVELVYVCVTSKNYPERLIFSSEIGSQPRLLQELRRVVKKAAPGGVPRALKKELPGLLERFNRADDLDKLSRVQSKVNDTLSAMQSVLTKATERDALLEDIQGVTKKLEVSAKEFSEGGKTLNRRACWSLWRVRIFVVVVVLLIVGAVVGFTKLGGVW